MRSYTGKSLRRGLLALGLLSATAVAPAGWADDLALLNPGADALGHPGAMSALPVGKSYVLGINRFDLDDHTEILGWQLSHSWYLGRQDGLDSGLTLVWQQKENQFSLSKDGLRLTRRF